MSYYNQTILIDLENENFKLKEALKSAVNRLEKSLLYCPELGTLVNEQDEELMKSLYDVLGKD